MFQAHGQGGAAPPAQQALLRRYVGAVYRYLLGAVRDPAVAEDLCQEFALRFLRGDFRRACPERGRFRDYLRTALIHLVHDHQRGRAHWPRPLAPDAPEPAAPGNEDEDSAFLAGWREELLERTWAALKAANEPYHAALLCRINQPDLSSGGMAVILSEQLGRVVTSAWVRKTLQRAHEKYGDLLLDEVACSLGGAGPEEVRAELTELGLLKYCASALARRAGQG
jgi:RNA polymerase sigma-70 factor (ECF subfamily)